MGKLRAGPDIQALQYSGKIWFSVNLAIQWSTVMSPLHLSAAFGKSVRILHRTCVIVGKMTVAFSRCKLCVR